MDICIDSVLYGFWDGDQGFFRPPFRGGGWGQELGVRGGKEWGDERAKLDWRILLRFMSPRCAGYGEHGWLEFHGLTPEATTCRRAARAMKRVIDAEPRRCPDSFNFRGFHQATPTLPLVRCAHWGGSTGSRRLMGSSCCLHGCSYWLACGVQLSHNALSLPYTLPIRADEFPFTAPQDT